MRRLGRKYLGRLVFLVVCLELRQNEVAASTLQSGWTLLMWNCVHLQILPFSKVDESAGGFEVVREAVGYWS